MLPLPFDDRYFNKAFDVFLASFMLGTSWIFPLSFLAIVLKGVQVAVTLVLYYFALIIIIVVIRLNSGAWSLEFSLCFRWRSS